MLCRCLKAFIASLLLVIIMLTLPACMQLNQATPKETYNCGVTLPGYYVYDEGSYLLAVSVSLWDESKTEYSEYSDIEQFLTATATGISTIAELTDEDWLSRYAQELNNKVVIRIEATEEGSHTAGGYLSRTTLVPTVFIKKALFAHGMAPVFHELCHVICQDYSSITLREGLACYMQDKVGKVPTVFNYGLNPDLIVHDTILSDSSNSNLISEVGAFDLSGTPAQTEQRSAYYVCSHSFAEYLIEAYGIDSFMAIYSATNEAAYATATEKTLPQLQSDWIAHLSTHEGKLDKSSYAQYLNELYAQHGMNNKG